MKMSDLTPNREYFEIRQLCHNDVYKRLAHLRKSLTDLKAASQKSLHSKTVCLQQEIEKVKLAKDEELQEKLNVLQAENEHLRTILQDAGKSDESKTRSELRLLEAENQIDELSRQLDRKLIHINQLQLELAEKSKAMFELEKSYVLLYYQYTRMQRKFFRQKKMDLISEENTKVF